MRKLLIFIMLAFTAIFMFTSCEESEKKKKARDAQKLYFDKYVVYDKVDSLNSGLTIYVGEVSGHKMMYQIYSGKFKGHMEVWHMIDECKACKKEEKKQ